MFGHLFELFLHAKSGIFAGIFLVGTTGALVTATVQNGVTTITITQQPNASPSGSASPSISPSTSPSGSGTVSASPSTSPSGSPSSSPSTNPECKAESQAARDATQLVDQAFKKYHTDLEHMRNDQDAKDQDKGPKSESARKIIENADKLLKEIRKDAVKAIHEQVKCVKLHDDEDEDGPDADKAERHNDDNFVVVFFNNLFGKHDSTSAATTTIVIGGSTVQEIADNAVAAMKTVFDTAVAQIQALPSPSPKPTKSPKPSRSPAQLDRNHQGDNGDNGKGKKDD